MKLVEASLVESVNLGGREVLRILASEHPSLSEVPLGAVSVRVAGSTYVIPSAGIRWLRYADDAPPAPPAPEPVKRGRK